MENIKEIEFSTRGLQKLFEQLYPDNVVEIAYDYSAYGYEWGVSGIKVLLKPKETVFDKADKDAVSSIRD